MSRLRIGKELERSLTAGSTITTNASNEQQYVAPGTNGQVFTMVAGSPAWAAGGNILTTLSYAPLTGILTYVDEAAVTTNINLPLEKFLSAAAFNSTTNILTLTLSDGSTVAVNMSDFVGYTFGISDGTTSQTVGVGTSEIITFIGTRGFTATVSATDTVTFAPPLGTVTGQVMTWNNTTLVWEATTPAAGSSFTVGGDSGTAQLINAGNTLSLLGAVNSGVKVAMSATDTARIGLNEQTDIFTGLTSGTTVTATQIPLAAKLNVYRNGRLADLTTDYTLAGSTVTFTTAFGISGGAQGSETVTLIYRYN